MAPGLAFVVAAVVATWPLVLHLASRVPLGTEREATVPVFSAWNLWWTSDRLPHGFADYLNAPFFHPNHGVTTYSEPMPLTGILDAPLWWLGAPPALAYNLALLALLALNGLFAYRLARALELPEAASIVAGVATVTLPITADLMGVLPNLALFGMLWTLEGLVRFGRTGSWGSAAWAAAGFAATFYTFEQWALFFSPIALAAALVALSLRGFGRSAAVRLAAAGLGAFALVLLLALPTLWRHSDIGFQRPASLVRALSANVGGYLTRPDTASLPVPPTDAGDTAGLFPGVLLLALAVAGAAAALIDRRHRRWGALLVGGAIFAFLLSLGLNLSLGGWRPFGTLRGLSRSFAEVRSPYRAAAIVQLVLPLLAAFALVAVSAVVRRGATVLVLAIGLLAAAENLALPARLARVPGSPATSWTRWLHDHPERRVVVHVPFPGGLAVKDYEIESWRLFAQIDHHKPLVNGYSGFFPVAKTPTGRTVPAYAAFQLDMARSFPNYQLLCTLTQGLKADTLVADRPWLADHARAMARFGGFLRPVYADEAVAIYALRTPSGRCRTGK